MRSGCCKVVTLRQMRTRLSRDPLFSQRYDRPPPKSLPGATCCTARGGLLTSSTACVFSLSLAADDGRSSRRLRPALLAMPG